MMLLAILLAAYFFPLGTLGSSKNRLQELFRPKAAREIYKSVSRIFWDAVFMVRNTVKIGQS